jgi:hypothetical protein
MKLTVLKPSIEGGAKAIDAAPANPAHRCRTQARLGRREGP